MNKTSPLLAYLRLFRLPNVFTAAADVLMGHLFVRGSLQPVGTFAVRDRCAVRAIHGGHGIK